MRRILLAVTALSLLLTTCGCTTQYIKKDTFSQAIPVTPEMLEEISREIFEGTGTGAIEADSLPEETLPPLTEDSTVYWLEGGEVCHASPDCRYVCGKEDTIIGTLTEAQTAGKDRVCSICYPQN